MRATFASIVTFGVFAWLCGCDVLDRSPITPVWQTASLGDVGCELDLPGPPEKLASFNKQGLNTRAYQVKTKRPAGKFEVIQFILPQQVDANRVKHVCSSTILTLGGEVPTLTQLQFGEWTAFDYHCNARRGRGMRIRAFWRPNDSKMYLLTAEVSDGKLMASYDRFFDSFRLTDGTWPETSPPAAEPESPTPEEPVQVAEIPAEDPGFEAPPETPPEPEPTSDPDSLTGRIERIGGRVVSQRAGDPTSVHTLIVLQSPEFDDALCGRLGEFAMCREMLIEGTSITDAGLIGLSNLSTLQRLSLRDNAVTDRGLETLQGIGSLTFLDLSGTQVSEAGLTGFRTSRPNVEVAYAPPVEKPAPGESVAEAPPVEVADPNVPPEATTDPAPIPGQIPPNPGDPVAGDDPPVPTGPPQLVEGSAEEIVQRLILRVTSGDTTELVSVIDENATGLLGQLRSGSAAKSRVEFAQRLFANVRLVGVVNREDVRTVNLINGEGLGLSFECRWFAKRYVIGDLTVSGRRRP